MPLLMLQWPINNVKFQYILAVRKAGHLNIKTKMFNYEARVLIGWLANTLVLIHHYEFYNLNIDISTMGYISTEPSL